MTNDSNQIVDLLQKLIKCKSLTPNSDGSLELVDQYLSKLGFITEIVEFHAPNTYSVKNLYAYLGNKSNKTLAVCGHLDVVPSGNEHNWLVQPFSGQIVDGYIIGRGAEDMKGNIASFLVALKDFVEHHQDQLKQSSIVMMFTLDEEALSINGIRKLVPYIITEKKHKLDACIVLEPTSIKTVGDNVKIGRRGSLNFEITVNGKQGHVAYPHEADNPFYRVSKIISSLQSANFGKATPNFQASNLEITAVESNSQVYNMIPSQVIIKGNIRYNDSYTLKSLQATIQDLIFSIDNHNTNIRFLDDASESFICNQDSAICQAITQAIIQSGGQQPSYDTSGGTSDARYICKYTDVIEFGLIEKTLHKVDEKVLVTDLTKLANIYLEFLTNFF